MFDLSSKSRLTKSELMVIEMLNENKWKRPVYFAVTVGDDYYLGLNDYFELTGLAYQVMPVSTGGKGAGVNTKEMYENMMHKFRWGNVADPKVYLDENTLRMCRTHRMMFSQLVSALIQENDTEEPKRRWILPWKYFREQQSATIILRCCLANTIMHWVNSPKGMRLWILWQKIVWKIWIGISA